MIAIPTRQQSLAFVAALLMVTSMVAVGGSAVAADAGQPELVTQSAADVDIADEVESEAEDSNGETVELYVRLDAAEASAVTTTETTSVSAKMDEAQQTQESLEAFADQSPNLHIKQSFWLDNAALVEVTLDDDTLEQISSIDGVVEIHPNYDVELAEPTESELSADAESPTTYGLDQVNAPAAWDTFDATGENASVAIIDTGVDPEHPALDGYDESNWAEYNFDGNPIDSSPYDNNGHGTHVSGTAVGGELGVTDDLSDLQIGVAPDAELYAINVFPDPNSGTSLAAIVAGMEHAVEEDVDVASLSLGGGGFAAVYIDVIENAHNYGTLVVSSSGNAGPGSTGTPANVYTGMAVGATDSTEQVTGFSTGAHVDTNGDWGYIAPNEWPAEYKTPDVSAPGDGVISAYPMDSGGVASLSGTSMAAPHTTGIAALLMSEHDLEPDEVKEVLQDSATKPADISNDVQEDAAAVGDADALFDDDVRDVRYGFGIVDAYDTFVAVEDSGTVTGTVVDADDNPVTDAGVRIGDSVGQNTAVDADGEFAFDVPAGEYEIEAGTFGLYGSETVEVTSDNTTDVTIEVGDVVDVAGDDGQPAEVAANDSFTLDVEVANLEAYTVSQSDDGTVGGDNLTITANGEEITFEESVDVDASDALPSDGEITIEVANDAGPGTEIGLNHTFSGPGDNITGDTGPTTVLIEGAERQPLEITAFDPPDEVFFNDPSSVSVNVTNSGDFTEEAVVYHRVESGGFVDIIPWEATLEPGETKQVELGPYNWFFFGGPGTQIDHQVSVNDVPTDFDGAPDDESAIETLTLTGSGPIAGQVDDADLDAPVGGATVTAVGPDGQTFQTQTNADGFYTFTEPTVVGEYDVTVSGSIYESETQTVEVDDLGGEVSLDFTVTSEPVYELALEPGEPQAIGFPGPVDDTVGDVLGEDFQGQAFVFDHENRSWVTADVGQEIDPMDAIVVIPLDGDDRDVVHAEIEFADDPTSDVPVKPESRDVSSGWNFIAPSGFEEADEAFAGSAGVVQVLATTGHPDSQMTPRPTFDAVGDGTVTPFGGYWVFYDDDGEVPSSVVEGMSLAESNAALGIDTEPIVGSVTGEVTGEPLDASIDVPAASYETVAVDGEYRLNYAPVDRPQDAFVDALGHEADLTEISQAQPNATLREDTFFAVTDLQAPDEVAVGDELEVTYEVTNLGTQAAEKNVETTFGQEFFARTAPNTYTLDTRSLELEPDESETVTVTVTLDEDVALADDYQQINVITDSTSLDIDDWATSEVLVFQDPEPAAAISPQAVGTVPDEFQDDTDEAFAGVLLDEVAAGPDNVVAITYEEAGETRVAFADPVPDTGLNEENVPFPILPDGVPDEHTVHVIPESDLSNETADTLDNETWVISDDTEAAAAVNDTAPVYDVDLTLDDQTYTGNTSEVTVETANLFDGAGNETKFVVDLHPTDDNGELIGDEFVGTTGVLNASNENVTIELQEELNETDDIVAMIHYVDDDDVGVGDDTMPGEFPALPTVEDGVPSVVTDTATVSIFDEEDTAVSLPEQGLQSYADDFELFVDVTADEGDHVVVTTTPDSDGGNFDGERIVGHVSLDDPVADERIAVPSEIVTGTSVAGDDYTAHVVTDLSNETLDDFTISNETLDNVADSNTAPVYVVGEFAFSDAAFEEPTDTVDIDELYVEYEGALGEDTVHLSLYDPQTDSYVGVSAADLSVNEAHQNVTVEVIEPIDPADPDPVRSDDTLEESGEYVGEVWLGAAGTDDDGERLPAQTELLTTGNSQVSEESLFGVYEVAELTFAEDTASDGEFRHATSSSSTTSTGTAAAEYLVIETADGGEVTVTDSLSFELNNSDIDEGVVVTPEDGASVTGEEISFRIYEGDGTIRQDPEITVRSGSDHIDIPVNVSYDTNPFTDSVFANYSVAISDDTDELDQETGERVIGIGHEVNATQNATTGTIEVTLPRSDETNPKWYADLRVGDLFQPEFHTELENEANADTYSTTFDATGLDSAAYRYSHLLFEEEPEGDFASPIIDIFGSPGFGPIVVQHFELSDIDPDEVTVEEDEQFDVNATVANLGDVDETQTLVVSVRGSTDDGAFASAPLAEANITLDSGDTGMVTFKDVDVSNLDPDTYELVISTQIGDESVIGQLTVEESTDEDSTETIDGTAVTTTVDTAVSA